MVRLVLRTGPAERIRYRTVPVAVPGRAQTKPFGLYDSSQDPKILGRLLDFPLDFPWLGGDDSGRQALRPCAPHVHAAFDIVFGRRRLVEALLCARSRMSARSHWGCLSPYPNVANIAVARSRCMQVYRISISLLMVVLESPCWVERGGCLTQDMLCATTLRAAEQVPGPSSPH